MFTDFAGVERTPHGKIVLFKVSTGKRIERWPVDARGMLECGEFRLDATEAVGEQGETDTLPHGFTIVDAGGGWFRLTNADGEQVGKSQRSAAKARALIPVTLQPGGTASPETIEHSTGVPLNATTEADAGAPAEIPGG